MRTFLSLLGILLFFGSCVAPRASFKTESFEEVVPSDIQFVNGSENAESYTWDFGDGNTSQEEQPTHRYLKSGTYSVKLTATKGKKQNSTEMELDLKAPKECLVQISTDYGDMVVQLYNETPQHRDNFLKLAEEGFYDGLMFHRIISGFMIQGGDPNSRDATVETSLGSGGPGYQIPAEFDENFVHIKGALAAARTGDMVNPEKKSSGSQFYIVQGEVVGGDMLDLLEARTGHAYSPAQREAYATLGGTPHLDGAYTVFGRVIEGLDVIDKIAAADTDGRDRPKKDIRMQVEVIK